MANNPSVQNALLQLQCYVVLRRHVLTYWWTSSCLNTTIEKQSDKLYIQLEINCMTYT